MVEIYKRFYFEAAHRLPQYDAVHGHSYAVEVHCAGPAEDGYVLDELEFSREIEAVRAGLDHRLLNDIIAVPTSENIARFIFAALSPKLSAKLTKVHVWRPSLGFGAIYRGD
jgi:6-pyruvoyltetrahydropterin/6-carboxytetrahydropterin synthase